MSSFLSVFEFVVHEVSLYSHTCKPLTTALVPTVPSSCFFRQCATITKVREGNILVASFALISFMIDKSSEVGGRVGHGLVLAWFKSYVLHLVFLCNHQDKRYTSAFYLPLSASQ